MSTVMKHHTGPVAPRPRRTQDDKQLRRDRTTALIVVSVMLALVALIIWLSSLGGGVEYDGIDYWHLMP